MLMLEGNSGYMNSGPATYPCSEIAWSDLFCFMEPVRPRKENIYQMWQMTFNSLNIYKLFIQIQRIFSFFHV